MREQSIIAAYEGTELTDEENRSNDFQGVAGQKRDDTKQQG